MNPIKKMTGYLTESRGFSPVRVILTIVYIAIVAVCAPLFADSTGQYARQVISIGGTVFGTYMLLRSLRKMFDKRVRAKIAAFGEKILRRTGEIFSRFGRKILKSLGLDRKRARGKDEKDFVFRERTGRRHPLHRLRNPMHWTELEDNAQRVRFIFIEYMLRNIRGGYKLRPSSTPEDISRELASEDNEKLLFETYALARYSGGREVIDDNTVEALSELKNKKKKN